jgi:hypothetical protein
VVQGEVQEVTLATRSRKRLSKKETVLSFVGGEIGANTQLNTCCKSKFAISKQKEM